VDVSIVIVSYNGRDYLRRCLTSIYEHTRDVDCEVIVVDNASADGSPEMVAAEFPQAALVRRAANGGFATGVNEGLRIARGEAFFILNPDSEITANILPTMLRYLRAHDDIAVLAPKLVDADGTLQLSCRAFPGFATALFNRYSLATKLFRNNRLSRGYLMADFDHSCVADIDWVSGAAWLMPRRAYEAVGPLDEAYFWSIEDVDYCQRVHRAGLRVVYFPEATVVHHIGRSAAAAPARSIIARHRGMWRYYRSYLRPQTPLLRQAVDVAVLAGIVLRAGAQLAGARLRQALESSKKAQEASVAVDRV
jgi:GT2 family glycosyltransferase